MTFAFYYTCVRPQCDFCILGRTQRKYSHTIECAMHHLISSHPVPWGASETCIYVKRDLHIYKRDLHIYKRDLYVYKRWEHSILGWTQWPYSHGKFKSMGIRLLWMAHCCSCSSFIFWYYSISQTQWPYFHGTFNSMGICSSIFSYGVATISRRLKIIGLFCRISSLL